MDTVLSAERSSDAVGSRSLLSGYSFYGYYRCCAVGRKGVQSGHLSWGSLRQLQPERIRITQGSLELEVGLKAADLCPLKAPADGAMARTIHESVACRVFYRFRKSGRTIFALESDRASVEYEYKKEG